MSKRPPYSVLWFPDGWAPTPASPDHDNANTLELFATAREAMAWAARQSVSAGGGAIVIAQLRASHLLIGKFGSVPARFAQAIVGRPSIFLRRET